MDVTMPQLGETVTEGTITKWFKQVGEKIDADEPLFEVSTDKVDSEVPAPQAGFVTAIVVQEGETVPVGAVLAVISEQAGAGGTPAAAPAEAPAPAPVAAEAPAPAPQAAPTPAPAPAPVAPVAAPAPPPPAPAAPAPVPVAANGGGAVTSPLVRRLIDEQQLDPASIKGSGEGGRITRNDVLDAARTRGPAPAPTSSPTPAPAAPAVSAPAAAPVARAAGDEIVPFDNIRRRTAEHMVRSLATSAHVYTSVRVDFERVERVRSAHQAEWKAEEGFALTYLPFITRAFCDVVHDYPHVNASVEGETLIVHRDINLGIAIDLQFKGLIAPVIRSADGKRLRLIAREIRDLASRAKSKQLSPDEIVGGTFTITNMGPFGTTQTFPIINQPQVAIMATDGIRKEPVVVEGPDGDDAIAVHHVGFLSLAWDHRAFDGAYAASFLNALRNVLETHDWEAELA
jgi:pyruvate dehydrogenase E2 component (dihydrolipoamide acetyltransferase)